MGTQQILMVVVSVIVVGAAIFFASQMFDSNASNSQRQQINADLQQFGAKILEYNITPPSIGGGKDCVCSLDSLSMFMGFDDEHTFQNYNGIYTIDSFSNKQVQISAMNTEKTIFLKLNVDLSKPSGEAVVVSYGSE